MTARRGLNLVFAWLWDATGAPEGEGWKNHFAEHFRYDARTQALVEARDVRRGRAPDKRATIELPRFRAKVPYRPDDTGGDS